MNKVVDFPGKGGHYDVEIKGWMNGFFRPLFCTINAELGRGQPGLMR